MLLLPWCGGLSTLSLDPADRCPDALQALLLTAAADVPASLISLPTNLVEVGSPVATSLMENFIRDGLAGGGGGGSCAAFCVAGVAGLTAAAPAAAASTASFSPLLPSMA